MIETTVELLPEVMPLDQAASILGVHPVTLRRAVDSGDLRASQIARRGGWIVQADDLRAFLELRATRPRERTRPTPEPAAPEHARRPRRRRADGGRVVIDPSWGRS
jgi:hypothetical protein